MKTKNKYQSIDIKSKGKCIGRWEHNVSVYHDYKTHTFWVIYKQGNKDYIISVYGYDGQTFTGADSFEEATKIGKSIAKDRANRKARYSLTKEAVKRLMDIL